MAQGEEGAPLLGSGSLSSIVPVDKYQLAYAIFVLQGLGILLPWNAFISAADYFSDLYGGSFVFFLSIAFNWSGALCFAVLMKSLPKFSFSSRVLSSLLIFFIVLMIIPFINHLHKSVSISITLIGVFFCGFATSVMQSSIAGLAALFPPEYIGGMMSGCGVAGVVAIILRIITKVSLPQNETGLEASGKLFFILAAGVIVLCAVSFFILLRLPVTQHNMTNYFKSKDRQLAGATQASFSQIVRKIWRDALAIILTFFVTLALFPGITGLVRSNDKNSNLSADWFSIIFTAIFMFGDLIGRMISRWIHIFSPQMLIFPVLARLVFFPLLVLCIHPRLITSDILYCIPCNKLLILYFDVIDIIMIVFALTNGYLTTLGMIYGPQKVAPHEKELTGIILAGCLTAGIMLGSHFAFLMLYLVTGNIGVNF